eukprot:6199901-Pleurochrysis_carterae.AAC.1
MPAPPCLDATRRAGPVSGAGAAARVPQRRVAAGVDVGVGVGGGGVRGGAHREGAQQHVARHAHRLVHQAGRGEDGRGGAVVVRMVLVVRCVDRRMVMVLVVERRVRVRLERLRTQTRRRGEESSRA